jgi:divalent metal cation (Fe/Co/Zn/Cd) transporter
LLFSIRSVFLVREMPLIEDGKTTVLLGTAINLGFLVLKFIVFLQTEVGLFFADTIDSFVDLSIILMIFLFLRFDFQNKVTFFNMDLMFMCQWSMVILFRFIIILDQVSDFLNPAPRTHADTVIISSGVILFFGIILIFLFVDEDDVIKCFISDEEKKLRKIQKAQNPQKKSKNCFTNMLPVFAEAVDNFVTTAIALVVGILLKLNIMVDYLYLIDDIGNIVISLFMLYIAFNGLWDLSGKYRNKSYFKTIFPLDDKSLNSPAKEPEDFDDLEQRRLLADQ